MNSDRKQNNVKERKHLSYIWFDNHTFIIVVVIKV